jgi:pyruvate, water dikinase
VNDSPAGLCQQESFALPLAAAREAATAGGKGASLGELARAGVTVPPGFVVTAGAFTAGLAAIDPDGALRAAVESVPAADIGSIARVAAACRERVTAAPLPPAVASAIESGYAALGDGPDVAVRSSATMEDSSAASFAGLQDTYLGVAGAGPVLDHVRRCWASLYNDESVAYRRRLGMAERDLAMAVVVQRMVRPRAAGVMFTRSPVTGDRSVVAIEGTWGLGSALVAGDVTPDSFVISKITGEITSRRVSAKGRIHSFIPNGRGVSVTDTPAELRERPCLTDDEIRALAAVARAVEAHYGAPQDIEWALLDEPDAPPAEPAPEPSPAERVVLLQSRPETVWAAKTAPPVAAPKPRPADHVLALFGKPASWI